MLKNPRFSKNRLELQSHSDIFQNPIAKAIPIFRIGTSMQRINPQAPVVQKIADEVVFRPPSDSDPHLLENTDLSPSRIHFSVGFISRSCFESDGFIAYSNE